MLLLPHGAEKSSTAAVYREFDTRRGDRGFEARVAALEQALRGGDLAGLPRTTSRRRRTRRGWRSWEHSAPT